MCLILEKKMCIEIEAVSLIWRNLMIIFKQNEVMLGLSGPWPPALISDSQPPAHGP